MVFLERAIDGQNQWWKYVIAIVAALVAANTIGAIPLFIVIIYGIIKNNGEVDLNPSNMMDFSGIGISSNITLAAMLFSFVVGLVTLILFFKPFHKRTLSEVINGTKKIRWSRMVVGGLVWLLISVVGLVIDLLTNPEDFTFLFNASSFIPLVFISILLIPLQCAFEELTFRGYLAQGIGAWTRNRWMVILIPSILFGILHLANPEVTEYGIAIMLPQYIIIGVVFGLISVLDDGIELAIGVHAINNIFASLAITHSSSVLQTNALFTAKVIDPYMGLLALMISSILFIAIVALKYRWKFTILNERIEALPTSNNTVYNDHQ